MKISPMVWISIPAGIFLGLGIGLLFNKPGEGLFIGMGAGFLLVLFLMIRKQ